MEWTNAERGELTEPLTGPSGGGDVSMMMVRFLGVTC